MPNAMPLILLGGAALLLMKKGKSTKVGEEPPGPGPLDELPKPDRSEPKDEDEDASTESLLDKCDRFIEEIWVEAEGDDELPINAIAVEESILPALRSYIENAVDQKGAAISSNEVVTGATVAAMESVAPGCGWNSVDSGWRYADGKPVDGKVRDVLLGVLKLVPQVTGDINAEKGYAKPGFTVGAKKTGLSTHKAKTNGGGGIGDLGG